MIRTSLFVGRTRSGYILLISILVIGVIATAVVSSLLFLGTSSSIVSLAIQQSSQAIGLAQACSEYALNQLRINPQTLASFEMIDHRSQESLAISLDQGRLVLMGQEEAQHPVSLPKLTQFLASLARLKVSRFRLAKSAVAAHAPAWTIKWLTLRAGLPTGPANEVAIYPIQGQLYALKDDEVLLLQSAVLSLPKGHELVAP